MTGLIGGDRAGLICDGKDDTSLYNTPVMKKFAGIMLPVILILIIDVLPPFQTVTHEDGTGSVAMLARQLSYSDHNPNTLAGSDYGRQWAVSAIMATLAWQKTSGIPDVYIAVLDTGIDEMHEDVAGQLPVHPEEEPGNGGNEQSGCHIMRPPLFPCWGPGIFSSLPIPVSGLIPSPAGPKTSIPLLSISSKTPCVMRARKWMPFCSARQ